MGISSKNLIPISPDYFEVLGALYALTDDGRDCGEFARLLRDMKCVCLRLCGHYGGLPSPVFNVRPTGCRLDTLDIVVLDAKLDPGVSNFIIGRCLLRRRLRMRTLRVWRRTVYRPGGKG